MTTSCWPIVAVFFVFLLGFSAAQTTDSTPRTTTVEEERTTVDVSHHVFCPQSYGLLDPLDALRYASTRNCSIGLPKWPSYIPVENQRRQVLEAIVGEEKIHYYCPFRTFFCDGVRVNGSKMANATEMGCYNFKTVGMITNYTLSTCHCEPKEGKEPLLVEPVHPSLSGAAIVYKKDFATCGVEDPAAPRGSTVGN